MQDCAKGIGEVRGGLEQQGRLADARLAADETRDPGTRRRRGPIELTDAPVDGRSAITVSMSA